MQETTTRAPGFVRPRFDDGTFDEPLPLEDHVLERVVHGAARSRLVIEGPRGCGLTTTIRWLEERIAAEGVTVFGPGKIVVSGDTACRALDRDEAVLLLDLSIGGRLDPTAWANAEALLKDACDRGWRAVAVAPEQPGRWGGLPVQVVKLAPWSRDDVIDALGAPRYLARRGALLQAVRGLPDADALLSRPRTALWVIEAALALAPDEPVTLGRIYANVLDTLAPSTLEVLRALPASDVSMGRALGVALQELPPELDLDADQLGALFELTAGFASWLARDEERRRALSVEEACLLFDLQGASRLALPGLQHMLQAGECLEAVARDAPPPRIAPAWFPFLRELITEATRERLRAWLTAPVQQERDGAAATLLWATGEVPPLDSRRRPPHLTDAWLEGLELPGAALGGAVVTRTRLTGARLQGARLAMSYVTDSALDGAALDGADLSHAKLKRTSLSRATLRGLGGSHLHLEGCSLRGACLEGATLDRAVIGACHLDGASLRRAALRQAKLFASPVSEADLGEVDLTGAEVANVDLSRASCFDPASLREALLVRCGLACLDLSEVAADASRWSQCELSDTRLARASLRDAVFQRCRAHGAAFDGADLRGAVFEAVSFQAGSSRSGLLAGKPALEGSMTGFYVEGTTDDAWASPESIRQASFRGADLRGAAFVSTNLFRVDLRDALMDCRLHTQAREQGAILGDA